MAETGTKKVKISTEGRIDEALATALSISRSVAKKIVEKGVKVNAKATDKPSYKVKIDEVVEYTPLVEESTDIIPNPNIKIKVIYEDDDLMVIDKPRGLVVHTAPGHKEDTLVNYLVTLQDEFKFDEDAMKGGRPGIVHRLDKDTSGLLLVAKTIPAEEGLQEQIRFHKVNRQYLALCYGDANEDSFTVDVPLTKPNHTEHKALPSKNGLRAITHFKKIWSNQKYSLLECTLETGRTHQIRAHLAYIGHPIVGDPLYCPYKDKRFQQGQLLHAYKISFVHPITGKPMSFEVPPDAYFKNAEKILKEDTGEIR